MKAVLLLSGGIDSTVLLADALNEGHHVLAVTFDYGQTHSCELAAAEMITDHYEVGWRVIPFELGGSAITGDGRPIPTEHADKVDASYVPARNLVMIAIAAHYAERFHAATVLIGANSDDAAGYPDCRPEFLTAISDAVGCGTARGISVAAPYLGATKADIVRRGRELDVPFDLTWSCYRGGAQPCGQCGACQSRQEAMA